MFVSSCDFNKDVFGVQSDFGVIRVDDWGKRTDDTIGIKYNRINWRITNDVQEFTEMFIFLLKS